MKKLRMKCVLAGIFVLIPVLLITGPALARTEFISIGTGGTGGHPGGG